MLLERDDDAVVAWRGWRYDPLRRVLKSLVWRDEWPRFRRMEAVIPSFEGFLGIHAWTHRDQLDGIVQLDSETVPVWGQVSLWGRIVQHEDGYRAQFAYPYSLLVLPKDKRYIPSLSAAYGVEATVI